MNTLSHVSIKVIGMILLFYLSLQSYAKLPEREELFTRSYNGTYNITSTVDSVVTGIGNVDLLICVPYPESNRYQDIVWRKEIPQELISYYPETERPYIKYAKYERDQGHVKIERDFIVTLYKVEFDWSAVTEIYPYDTEDEEYKIYTRAYQIDGDDSQEACDWINNQRDIISANTNGDILEYIKGAYRLVAANFTYGTATSFADAIVRRIGECGYLSAVFVSLLKAKGIPARSMVCMRPNSGCHVWAEFYLQNYGWISADVTHDLGRSDNFEWFGENRDNCIVMSYDTGFTVTSAKGKIKNNVFVQKLAWWFSWFWEGDADETKRNVKTSFTFGSKLGKIQDDGKFVSVEEIFEEWSRLGIVEHSVFTFDTTINNSLSNGYKIHQSDNCSYLPSPLGIAIKLECESGPYSSATLNLQNNWTILSSVRTCDIDNAVLFSLGSSKKKYSGISLASRGTNQIILAHWQNGEPHTDLISVTVPDASIKYHAYAIRTIDKTIELFVDGVKAGSSKLNSIPTFGLQFFGVYNGIGNTRLENPVGACIDDWRFCQSPLDESTIKLYASIIDRHNNVSISTPNPAPDIDPELTPIPTPSTPIPNPDSEPTPTPEPEPTPTPNPVPTPTPEPDSEAKPTLGERPYSLIGDAFDGSVPTGAASVYDGYLYSENTVYGIIQVKVAKPKTNKKTGDITSKASAVIQIIGAKKVTLKGDMDVVNGRFEVPAKNGDILVLCFGADGIFGSFGNYHVEGVRNLFSSKDKTEKASAEAALEDWLGALNVKCDNGVLSVTVAKKGKVTIKGTYEDAKVSVKAQALIGEDMICIPVVYSKKSVNLAFTVWLPIDGGNAEVVGLDGAVIGKAGTLKSNAKFRIEADILADIPSAIDEIDGHKLLPDGESVTASGKKWVVADGAKAAKVAYKKGEPTITEGKKGAGIANASGLKLTYKSKDGSFTGSFTVYALENNKLKKHKATVSGVLINGVGYGTATIKKLGSWDILIE